MLLSGWVDPRITQLTRTCMKILEGQALPLKERPVLSPSGQFKHKSWTWMFRPILGGFPYFKPPVGVTNRPVGPYKDTALSESPYFPSTSNHLEAPSFSCEISGGGFFGLVGALWWWKRVQFFSQMFCRDSVGLGVSWVVGCLIISVGCICSAMCQHVSTIFKASWISRYLATLWFGRFWHSLAFSISREIDQPNR